MILMPRKKRMIVHRRIGGLERTSRSIRIYSKVHRRIGGLEKLELI